MGALLRFVPVILTWLGTASTGWFLSDWFNESSRTEQLQAVNPDYSPPSFWTRNRVIALLLGLLALGLWLWNRSRRNRH